MSKTKHERFIIETIAWIVAVWIIYIIIERIKN